MCGGILRRTKASAERFRRAGLFAAKAFATKIDNKITTYIVAEFVVEKTFYVASMVMDAEPVGESSTPKKQVEAHTIAALNEYIEDKSSVSTIDDSKSQNKYTTTKTDR